jgi:hypothetical protein
MTTYRISQDRSEDLIFCCDLDRAEAPIRYQGDTKDEWIQTPYQTADARHNLYEAARLACDYAQFPFGEDEDGNEVEVSIYDMQTGERVV